jgi:hypothetical protein
MNTGRSLLLIALALCWPVSAAAQAQSDRTPEAFTAIAISAGGPLSSPVAGRLEIIIERWSTDAERQRLLGSLKRGQDATLDVMRSLRAVGSVRTPGNLAWDLRYAHQVPGEDGGRHIYLATDRPVSAAEAVARPRTIEYPFTFIELRVNDAGEGEGRLSQAMRIRASADGRYVHLENYASEPIALNEVRRR